MLIGLAALGLVMGKSSSAQSKESPASSAVAALPPGPMAAKATTACTECHEARIIVQQRLSKGSWVKEVDKMIKWGAVVDAADHDALVDYFSSNFGPDQPPYEAPYSSANKAGGRSAK